MIYYWAISQKSLPLNISLSSTNIPLISLVRPSDSDICSMTWATPLISDPPVLASPPGLPHHPCLTGPVTARVTQGPPGFLGPTASSVTSLRMSLWLILWLVLFVLKRTSTCSQAPTPHSPPPCSTPSHVPQHPPPGGLVGWVLARSDRCFLPGVDRVFAGCFGRLPRWVGWLVDDWDLGRHR